MIRYSLIMPVYNASRRLFQVLEPLSQLGQQWEIILVNDGSTDDTAEVLKHFSHQVLHQTQCCGVSRARNLGVQKARGDILIFLDSDVVTSSENLNRMVKFLEQRPDLDGVFGSYSQSGYPQESPLSRFRNLLHRYVHHCSAGPATTFWGGLGAMRRNIFLQSGGFNPQLDGIEDLELGCRITQQGGKFWLEPAFEGCHLKRWNLKTVIYTDIYLRACTWTFYGWLGLTPRSGMNLSPRFSLPPLFLLLACLLWPLHTGLALVTLFLYLLANTGTYRFMARSANLSLALSSIIYLIVHHSCCLVGALLGTLRYALYKGLRWLQLKS